MQVLLPYKASKPPTSIHIEQSATSAKPPEPTQWCPRFTFSPDQGEVIEIPLPPPDTEGLAEVVVQFTWPDGAEPMPSKKIDKTKVRERIANDRVARLGGKAGPVSVEERLGDLYRALTPQGKSMQVMGFRSKVLPNSTKTRSAANQAQKPSPYAQQNAALVCAAPETTTLTKKSAEQPPPSPAKRVAPPSHTEKDTWDKATIVPLCTAYDNYEHPEKKIPADIMQKLKILCGDKRLQK